MSSFSPRDLAPSESRRTQLVAEVLDGLEGTEELPLAQEAQRLADAQALLARVLNNDSSLVSSSYPLPDEA